MREKSEFSFLPFDAQLYENNVCDDVDYDGMALCCFLFPLPPPTVFPFSGFELCFSVFKFANI